jgi:hypothetical protein
MSTIDYSEDDSDATKVMEKDDQRDILLDDSQALGNHRGTCRFVKCVGKYARQHTGWSNAIFDSIHKEFQECRFLMSGLGDDQTRRAARSEITEFTKKLFQGGGGKQGKSKKRRGRSKGKKSSVKKDSKKSESESGMTGASVYAFEQLWSGTIIDSKESKSNGKQYKMRWDGFNASGDGWVSEHQIVTPTMPKPKRFLQRLAAETYSKFTCGDSDEDEEEEVVAPPPPPKRRRISLHTTSTSSSTSNAAKEDASTEDEDPSFQQDDKSGERVTCKWQKPCVTLPSRKQRRAVMITIMFGSWRWPR